jgi:hypothetical protein
MLKDRGNEPKSLLRRLLDQADKLQKQTSVQSPDPAPAPSETPANSTPVPPAKPPLVIPAESPVRPAPPAPVDAPDALEPSAPKTRGGPVSTPIPSLIATTEDRLQAEGALTRLREKTMQVANDFASGKINRVQFSSLYTHYNEKIIIIERMLARDPNSQAWQSVARPGHTTFLKQHYEAHTLAFSIYDYTSFEPITVQGGTPMPEGAITQILQALRLVRQSRTDLKPLSRKISVGNWLVIVPGVYTVAIALYSLEPAVYQIKIARDLHLDFERANRHALERGIRQPEQLVFPHRALFEQHGEG